MSPTEDELRAALRDGEGDALDPETVLRRARDEGAALRDRRVRLASVAAIAAVVAGIGVTGGIVLSHDNHQSRAASRADQNANAAAGYGAAGNASAPAKNTPNLPAAECPATWNKDILPTYVPSSTFFIKPVATITVCAYPSAGGAPIRDGGSAFSVTLRGADATALASSIEQAPAKLDARPCPLYRTASAVTLLMVPTATDGTRLPYVTTMALQNPCNAPITNGRTTRYNWTPPATLNSFLARLAELVATATPSHS